MKKTWISIGAVAFATCLAAVFFACRPHGETKQTVAIGAVLPLTGSASEFGRTFFNALTLAVEDANQSAGQGDLKFELYVEDGQGDPKTSVTALERLLATKRPPVVFACLSAVTLALIPVTERNGVLMFADAAHPEITRRGNLVLRHSNIASHEARAMARIIRGSPDSNRVAVIALNDDYGRAVASYLTTELGQSPKISTRTEFYEGTATDVTPTVNAALEPSPEWMAVAGYGNSPGLVVRRLRERGFTRPIVTSLPFLLSRDGIAAVGDATNNLFCVTYNLPNSEAISDFVKRYKAEFGTQPGLTVFQDYASFQLLAAIIRKTGPTPNAIKIEAVRMKEFDGLSGHLTIETTGDIASPVTVTSFGNLSLP
jgi:branched-chain amino acid transport system substrate-binding protein